MAETITVNQLFGQMVMKGHNGSISTPLLTETTGELKVSNIGLAGSTLTNFKVETTGEQDVVLHGKDSAQNIDPFRTNDNQELIVDIKTQGRTEYVEPDDMPGTNTTYYTNNNTGKNVKIEIEVVNNSSSDATATVDLVESGGTAAANRRILNAVNLTANQVGIRLGPYILEPSGTVQGLAGTANAITIHVVVLEILTV
jgi:hypothetical protein